MTRLFTTSAGVAQTDATRPLQQALKVWTATPGDGNGDWGMRMEWAELVLLLLLLLLLLFHMRFGSVVAQEDLEWITLRASFKFLMLVLMDITGNAQLGMGQSPGSLVGNQNSWLMAYGCSFPQKRF
jgi:hypothetical protein